MSTAPAIRYNFIAVPRPGFDLTQFLAQLSAISLICLSVTAPVIRLGGDLPWIRVEQLLFPIVAFVYLLLMLAGRARTIRLNGMMLVGLAFCFCVLLSLWYSADVLGYKLTGADFYEIPKLWIPVVAFTVMYEANLSEISLQRLLRVFSAVIFLICLFAWAQWFNLGPTRILNAIYFGGEHIEGALIRYRRVFATLGNANVLGQVMTWSIAALSLSILAPVGNKLRNLVILLACLTTLAMTGSRYGLFTAALTLVLVFFMPTSVRQSRGSRFLTVGAALAAFMVIVAIVAINNQATFQRYQSLQHPLQVDSLRGRVDDVWLTAFDFISKSPILGNGPAHTLHGPEVTDSEYLDVLQNYGVVGFLPYLGYFLFPAYLLIRGLLRTRHLGPQLELRLPATFLTVRLGLIMILTGLIMNFGMSTYYHRILQTFIWMWLGIAACSAQKLSLAARSTPHADFQNNQPTLLAGSQ